MEKKQPSTTKLISKPFKYLLLAIVALNVYFASWNVLHGNLYFHTDIARDFLLLQDLVEKKIVLIGERAGVYGVFHGPLWLYINAPAFIIGHGNPVVVAWFWILLTIVFLFVSYKIAKHIFSASVALIFVVLLSALVITSSAQYTHPQGAFFLMPVVFFTLWQYVKTNKIIFLAAHVLLAGLLIQFEMAAGVPFVIMSFIYVTVFCARRKTLLHLLAYLLILIPLLTFILFDLRHDFFQLKNFIAYLGEKPGNSFDLITFIVKRIDYFLTLGAPFVLNRESSLQNKPYVLFFIFFVITLIKNNTNRLFYLTSFYFIFGYFLFTLVNKGNLQGHQFLPFVPIVFLAFASIYETKFKNQFLVILAMILITNYALAQRFIIESRIHVYNDRNSWARLNEVANYVVSGPEKELGYFTYAPDAYAYQIKYAILYASKKHPEKNILSFQKKPVTYVIAEPPPPLQPWLSEEWWIKEKINIADDPEAVKEYVSKYKVKKYFLKEQETQIPFDPTADTGIHFR